MHRSQSLGEAGAAALIFLFVCASFSPAAEPSSTTVPVVPDAPIPTLLATRGELMLDDVGDIDHSGRGLGTWSRSPEDPKVWRVTHTDGHIPTAPYSNLPMHENVIVEVTFRWGESMGGKNDDQFVALVSDLRPGVRGHKVEAWAIAKGRFGKPGLTIKSSNTGEGMIAEKQFDGLKPNIWHTAVLEIVGEEALFRLGEQVAYGKAPIVAGPKNKIVLFIGTTWHEIKRVRIWHASANPEWEGIKAKVLE